MGQPVNMWRQALTSSMGNRSGNSPNYGGLQQRLQQGNQQLANNPSMNPGLFNQIMNPGQKQAIWNNLPQDKQKQWASQGADPSYINPGPINQYHSVGGGGQGQSKVWHALNQGYLPQRPPGGGPQGGYPGPQGGPPIFPGRGGPSGVGQIQGGGRRDPGSMPEFPGGGPAYLNQAGNKVTQGQYNDPARQREHDRRLAERERNNQQANSPRGKLMAEGNELRRAMPRQGNLYSGDQALGYDEWEKIYKKQEQGRKMMDRMGPRLPGQTNQQPNYQQLYNNYASGYGANRDRYSTQMQDWQAKNQDWRSRMFPGGGQGGGQGFNLQEWLNGAQPWQGTDMNENLGRPGGGQPRQNTDMNENLGKPGERQGPPGQRQWDGNWQGGMPGAGGFGNGDSLVYGPEPAPQWGPFQNPPAQAGGQARYSEPKYKPSHGKKKPPAGGGGPSPNPRAQPQPLPGGAPSPWVGPGWNIGGGHGGLAISDRRLKSNIRQIGTRDGLPLYSFDYVWGAPGVGHMADEVARAYPAAVITTPGGFQTVDYGRIGNGH